MGYKYDQHFLDMIYRTGQSWDELASSGYSISREEAIKAINNKSICGYLNGMKPYGIEITEYSRLMHLAFDEEFYHLDFSCSGWDSGTKNGYILLKELHDYLENDLIRNRIKDISFQMDDLQQGYKHVEPQVPDHILEREFAQYQLEQLDNASITPQQEEDLELESRIREQADEYRDKF